MRDIEVVVLGAANLDLVYRVDRLPHEGETTSSLSTDTHPGGKGLNQAIAAARSGTSTAFIGATGPDAPGSLLRDVLTTAGVMGSPRESDQPTGTAIITVDHEGRNTIVLSGGANDTLGELQPGEIEAISSAAVLLLQLELDPDIALAAAEVATAANTRVVLNAAPMRAVPPAIIPLIDVLIVNEHEARELASAWEASAGSPDGSAPTFPIMIVTLGERGVDVMVDGGASQHIDAIPSPVVDTTGAGDTFCGAFVAQLAAGHRLDDAVRYAVAAGALSVRRHGAASSIPQDADIRALLNTVAEDSGPTGIA